MTLLRSEGLDVHGQISHPDPYAAVIQTLEDERVDEIIVSTFPGARSGWLRRDLLERLRADTKLPLDHVEVDVPVEVTRLMAAHAHAEHHEQHGPPAPHYSSRVTPGVLGMFLFIGTEIMLFGSFFTAYFFVRVVERDAVADAAVPPAGLRRVHQHVHPRHVELHDALGAPVDQARQRLRAARGTAADVPDGVDVPRHAGRRVLAGRVRHEDGAFATIFFCLTGLHGAHVFVGLSILLFMTIRAFRGHFSAEHHHGVEIGGIYWHFVDVMWIVVYMTVYIL